jgi:predicted phage terminase large subunit-like protein
MLNPVFKEIVTNDFYWFAFHAFKFLNPGKQLGSAWHLVYLSQVIHNLERSQNKILIINIPPRNLKSTLISVLWPAWLLGRDPAKRILVASYSQKLSNKLSLDSRFIMNCKWYKEAFPDVVIAEDQNEKHKFMTTAQGFRMAVSTNGMVTGEGGDILILDDPHNPKEIFSDKLRNKTIHWFDQVFSSRLNNQKHGKIVLVMQRLHYQDLAGYLIEKGCCDVINLPIIFPHDRQITIANNTKEIKQGDLLDPERFDYATIEHLRKQIGENAFAAQYLGEPILMSGNFIKKEHIVFTDVIPGNPDQIIQSWDSASCNTQESDYSVCTTWYVVGNIFYLIDLFREKCTFLQLKEAMLNCAAKHKPELILVEGKSSGLALYDEMLGKGMPAIKVNPQEDKISRLMHVLCYFERLQVKFCISEYNHLALQNELLQFPQGSYDDQVDSITQFLLWFKKRRFGSIKHM